MAHFYVAFDCNIFSPSPPVHFCLNPTVNKSCKTVIINVSSRSEICNAHGKVQHQCGQTHICSVSRPHRVCNRVDSGTGNDPPSSGRRNARSLRSQRRRSGRLKTCRQRDRWRCFEKITLGCYCSISRSNVS